MIIEQHYDEEVLIALLGEQKDAIVRDPHIASCGTCASALDSIRQVTTALHDDVVWDRRELSEEPVPATRDALRSFASAASSEDAVAEPRVKAMLAKSHEEWQPTIEQHPEWRTAGFVRRVIAAVDAINFTSPTDAVELTKIAVEVAEALPGNTERLKKLRASAWREYAYALFYVGSHNLALTAVGRCDEILNSCVVAEYDAARSTLMRAIIYSIIERSSEALLLAKAAEAVFLKFGDARRAVSAAVTRVSMLMRLGLYSEALPLNLRIREQPLADWMTRTTAVHHAAICSRELGDYAHSKLLLAQTIEECDRLGYSSLGATARWNFAKLLVAEGQVDAAIALFGRVRSELEELGMAHAVALICIDTAEALLLRGTLSEVSQLCAFAMDYFERAQIAYTVGALSALAYMREAAEAESLTIGHVNDVRAFFEVLPKQPQLLFARSA